MLYNLTILMPSSICLVWGLVFLMHPKKTSWQVVWTVAAFSALISFTCDACFMARHINYDGLPAADVLSSLFTTSLPPLLFIYVLFLQKKRFKYWYLLLFIIPISLSSVLFINYITMGHDVAVSYMQTKENTFGFPEGFDDRIFHVQYVCGARLYYLFVGLGALLLVGYIIYSMARNSFSLYRFLSAARLGNIFVEDLVNILILATCTLFAVKVAGRVFYARDEGWNAFVNVLHAILAYDTCHAVTYTDRQFINWQMLVNPFFDPEKENVSKLSIGSGLSEEIPESSYDRFLKEFERIVIYDERYLDPHLSIDSLAAEMNTNRTYLSRLVNRRFKTSFRDYINTKRIERAKILMEGNPTALIEHVAKSSGFLSTSQFNRKFKEVEGCSPRAWQLKNKNI